MRRTSSLRPALIAAIALAVVAVGAPALAQEDQAPGRRPDVIYVPTPVEVVEAMLDVAHVTSRDVVYDLGCGDGRIVVAAAKLHGAHGVGIDIDPERIEEATANVEKEGVGDRVEIRQADLFETDVSPASVVTLYLLPSLNLKIRPKLWQELKVGSRVVSHAFDMGDWEPEQTLNVNGRTVYYWTITEAVNKRASAGGF